ncbi:helix-turn-helix domain-containing protein [Gordoniibacillus kamchatkensis]|uniref:helix-turn-helix domain-containing protein n=1 Tax=Gordoniibacillus kamchatkensis TaxID=1590651 RepID=UPI000AEBC56F|nr:helix-turn-helix domain-containing protein [Paenibacillus sp. VKM B-2647]
MDIGHRIKELRERQGWSQDQLAELLGMNRANVSNYERGVITNIPSEIIVKLAALFGTSTDYLLGTSTTSDQQKQVERRSNTARNERDLRKFLQQSDVMFDGVPLSEDDRRRVQDVLTGLFWEAKQMNRRSR